MFIAIFVSCKDRRVVLTSKKAYDFRTAVKSATLEMPKAMNQNLSHLKVTTHFCLTVLILGSTSGV